MRDLWRSFLGLVALTLFFLLLAGLGALAWWGVESFWGLLR